MRGVIVRPASAADGVVIGSILNALLATTAIEWTDTPHTADSILEWLDDHETVLVAEDGGTVVGVAAFGWFRDVKWPATGSPSKTRCTYEKTTGDQELAERSWKRSSTRLGIEECTRWLPRSTARTGLRSGSTSDWALSRWVVCPNSVQSSAGGTICAYSSSALIPDECLNGPGAPDA